jgi:hypothetical protein
MCLSSSNSHSAVPQNSAGWGPGRVSSKPHARDHGGWGPALVASPHTVQTSESLMFFYDVFFLLTFPIAAPEESATLSQTRRDDGGWGPSLVAPPEPRGDSGGWGPSRVAPPESRGDTGGWGPGLVDSPL